MSINNEALYKAILLEDRKESIRTYLEIVSEEDKQLKLGLENPSKNYNECLAYIDAEARKYLKGKNGHISPLIVYGWAIHYFTEENLNDDDVQPEITESPFYKEDSFDLSALKKSLGI